MGVSGVIPAILKSLGFTGPLGTFWTAGQELLPDPLNKSTEVPADASDDPHYMGVPVG